LSPSSTEASTGSAIVDELPPFAQLLTDDEREKKAGHSSPGTYHVVVNPDSFSHLPEYTDDLEIKRERLSPLRRGSIAASLASSYGRESAIEGVALPGDPNTVVLPRFEDVVRRNTAKDVKSPKSPTIARIKTEDFEQALADAELAHSSTDEIYLRQFRKVVWRQLVPAEIQHLDGMGSSSVIILESEASFFPPVGILNRYTGSADNVSYIMP
jgi:hypothetical protein